MWVNHDPKPVLIPWCEDGMRKLNIEPGANYTPRHFMRKTCDAEFFAPIRGTINQWCRKPPGLDIEPFDKHGSEPLMATLAVYYDRYNRLALDHSRMPRGVVSGVLNVEEPTDGDLEALAQQLARLLLAQIKDQAA